ncbi:ATP-binding protein [Thalassospira australica]|uniref:ATP-binding protein n=1 Tax=Thalassospira australica TaxID=1528106 RepID=UPI00384F0453
MPKILSLSGISFFAFCAIAPAFIYFTSLSDEQVGSVTIAIIVVVEFIALLSMCLGGIVFDITKRRQILYIAASMGLLLISDLLGMPKLFETRPVIGGEQALGTFTGLLILVLRFGSFSFLVLSWYIANKSENRPGNDLAWGMVPGIFAMGLVVQVFLIWLVPEFSSDFAGVLENVSTLILFPTMIMLVTAAAGYLVRCYFQFRLSECLLTVAFLIGCFNHLALFTFGPDNADMVARFIIPSRLLSYTCAMLFMLLELRDHYRQSFEASSAKSQFLATMSHEIRTPLNGVLGMAQLLQQSELDAAQKERVGAILSSGRALMALLNDILDMSKIEAGRVELEKRPFYPSDITYDIFRAIGDTAREKNLLLRCDDAALTDRIFVGDEVRFRQILWNLLSNAVKFTRKGAVRLEVKSSVDVPEQMRAPADGEELFHFTVIDTGIGIAPERQGQIFSPFSQGDNSTTRQFGGTGLGLSIAHSLIELMGGTISFESVEGQGTRFDFWLPFEAQKTDIHDRAAGQHAVAIVGDSVLSGYRILVAEDNEINANVIGGLLQRHGLMVDIVPNGREAVHAFQGGGYDAILMDAHMPVLDGEGATRHIRELERVTRGGRIPIICVTAEAFNDRHRDFLAAGMDEVMTKPIEERRLYSVLLRFLRNRNRVGEGRAVVDEPRKPTSIRVESGENGQLALSGASRVSLTQQTEEESGAELVVKSLPEGRATRTEERAELIDTARFKEMSSMLGTGDMARLVDMLPASYQEERAKIVAAIANGDRESIRTAAHTIKGMASNLAAVKLAADARALELYEGELDSTIDDRIVKLDRLAQDTADAMRKMLRV